MPITLELRACKENPWPKFSHERATGQPPECDFATTEKGRFFTVYVRLPDGTARAIGDYPTLAEALEQHPYLR